MKAKKQELVKSVLKWLGETQYMTYDTKNEIQDLADRFIDHHDRKKKSKFGSDKEVVKLKEEPKKENVGKLAKVIADAPIGLGDTHKVEIGTYIKILSCDKSLYFGNDLHGASKGFLPSDLEILEEPKEKTFEEWKAIFPIGSKARVIGDTINHHIEIGSIIDVPEYYNDSDVSDKMMGVYIHHNCVRFCDLEPIQEPKFKVGDKVECRTDEIIRSKGEIIASHIAEGYFTIKFDSAKLMCHESNLKLIKND